MFNIKKYSVFQDGFFTTHLTKESTKEEIEKFIYICINREIEYVKWRNYLLCNVFYEDSLGYENFTKQFFIRLKYNDYKQNTTREVKEFIKNIGI